MYLFPFLTSFFISVVLLTMAVWLSKKIKQKSRKSARHIHPQKISRLGGAAIIIAFLAVLFLDRNLFISSELWGVIIASILVLAVGLWDDFRELDWKIQLFFQIAIAILIFIFGVRVEYITNPFGGYVFLNLGRYLIPSLLFVIGWILLLVNSTNWLDGIDGLSGGVGLIAALTIFFLSLKPEVNQPPVAIIAIALAGAIAGFLIFNFHPAKILAGTSGSMFIGFILAVLAIFAGVKIATALLVMAVPVIDTFWVIGERVISGKSIFEPDNRHLHYKLMRLGWSQRKITLFFYAVTAVIALVALSTRAIGKIITVFLVTIITLFVFFIIDRKTKNAKIA
jgi:UDP-GlcNAc:undecaprenyl-phosphate/decaprenyl-phosphate GlcNAc-1-phosphate transferase